jgi:hypothetical protein
MIIGVISDTHIPATAKRIPETILDAFRRVDMVVHAGDMIGLEAIEELKTVCPKVIAVSGNMDNDEIRLKYPVKDLFKIGDFKIGLMHGFGSPANLISVLEDAFKLDKPDLIIFGHSHKPFNERVNGILFFNPGSATDTITAEYNSYGIIEITDQINARIVRI